MLQTEAYLTVVIYDRKTFIVQVAEIALVEHYSRAQMLDQDRSSDGSPGGKMFDDYKTMLIEIKRV